MILRLVFSMCANTVLDSGCPAAHPFVCTMALTTDGHSANVALVNDIAWLCEGLTNQSMLIVFLASHTLLPCPRDVYTCCDTCYSCIGGGRIRRQGIHVWPVGYNPCVLRKLLYH